MAGGQQAGEECAESEERGGCEETTRGKGALHPVGEDGAEKISNARPMTMPAAVLTSAMRVATHRTFVRGAPSAKRMPNSVVRWATLYATRLKMPTSASPSAMAEKTPNKMEKSRWRLYCASCSMASFRVKAPLEICWSEATDATAARMECR